MGLPCNPTMMQYARRRRRSDSEITLPAIVKPSKATDIATSDLVGRLVPGHPNCPLLD